MSGIVPTAGKKRGRMLRTDTGREISHEEVVYGLIKRTAVEVVNAGTCACGGVIVQPRKGRAPIRCDVCDAEKRRAYERDRNHKSGAVATNRRQRTLQQTLAHMVKRRETHRATMARYKQERKDAGLCQLCGKNPSDNGTARCLPCKANGKSKS